MGGVWSRENVALLSSCACAGTGGGAFAQAAGEEMGKRSVHSSTTLMFPSKGECEKRDLG